MHSFWFMLAFASFGLTYAQKSLLGGQDCTQQRCLVPEPSLRFFLLGDWGGLPIWPWYSYAQSTVAETMGNMATTENTHFQLALGDNIYITGVSNANDARFKKTFEDVYTANHLKSTPWYVLAGNHDHYGNVTGEVAYTKLSSRWNFPSLYYTVKYQLSDATKVDIVMIDTIVLCGNTRDLKNTNLYEYMMTESHEPMGPEDVMAAEEQWTWLETQLKASTAQYLFVAGHFPVYSIAEHGPTSTLVDRLKPLLTKYKVNAYFSGHDHNLQHLQEGALDWTVNYVLSGNGAFADNSDKHKDDIPAGVSKYFYAGHSFIFGEVGLGHGGFVYTDIDASAGTFTYYDGQGNKLYGFQTAPRT